MNDKTSDNMLPRIVHNMMHNPLRVSTEFATQFSSIDSYLHDTNLEQKVRQARLKSQYTLVRIADLILLGLRLITIRETAEILYYDAAVGIWNYNAETHVACFIHFMDPCFTKHQIAEILDKIRRMTYVNEKIINNKHVLACENKTIDLKLFIPVEHSFENYLTRKIPVFFNSKVNCPRITKFFEEILPGSPDLLFDLTAYCLVPGYPIHRFFILYGEGKNGKTKYLQLLRTFLGDENVSGVALQQFQDNRFAASRLIGKMANIYADLSYKALNDTGVIKLVTGEDSFDSDRKNKDFIKVKNQAKMIFSTNRLPPIRNDNTFAIDRRRTIIKFNQTFDGKKADINLLQKITTQDELSGLLNECLKRIPTLLSRGDFAGCDSPEETRIKYLLHSDSVQAFCELMLDIDKENFYTNDELYDSYVTFCRELKLEVRTQDTLTRNIQRYVPEVIKTQRKLNKKSRRVWKNIKVNWNELTSIKSTMNSELGDTCPTKHICTSTSGKQKNITRGGGTKNMCQVGLMSPAFFIIEKIKEIIEIDGPEPVHVDTILHYVSESTKASLKDITNILDRMNNEGELFMPSLKTYKLIS